jgi:hypothetical protein
MAHNLPPTLQYVSYSSVLNTYHHVRGQKGASGSKLEPLMNVCCEVMINFPSQLQECTACQEDHLGDILQELQCCELSYFFTIDSVVNT